LASSDSRAILQSKDEIIQLLNIIIGHHPKSGSNVATFAGNRHYLLDPADKYDLTGGLQALRGYLVSVRAATGRPLLNIQIKHAACYRDCALIEMFRTGDIGGDNAWHRFLKKVKVRTTHLRRDRPGPPKTIVGFAMPSDGRNQTNPPRVTRFGATPSQVSFFLTAQGESPKPSPSGKKKKKGGAGGGGGATGGAAGGYITVADYFKQSKQFFRTKRWEIG
jgi:hypothetical protein